MNTALLPLAYGRSLGLGVTAWSHKESTTYQGFASLDLSQPLGPADLGIAVPCVTRSSYERDEDASPRLYTRQWSARATIYTPFGK